MLAVANVFQELREASGERKLVRYDLYHQFMTGEASTHQGRLDHIWLANLVKIMSCSRILPVAHKKEAVAWCPPDGSVKCGVIPQPIRG